MTDIPPGWNATTLGALGRYLNGRAFKKSEWSTSGRPIIRIQNLTGSSDVVNRYEGDVEERYVVRPGDLLVSWAATLGAYIWSGEEGVLNQHIFKVESRIDRRFHKYLLDHKLAELMQHTHGSGMVHITRSRFDSVPVVIPPHDEQGRIVDILDDHLSRLDAAKDCLSAAVKRARGLEQSALDRIIWGEAPATVPVSSVLREPMRNGFSARASSTGTVRVLTLTAVTRRSFTDKYTKLTDAAPDRVRRLWIEPGDIFVQRANTPDLVGSSALYTGPSNWAVFPDLLIRLRADTTQVLPEYLALALQTERCHRALRARAKGLAGSMPKVDQTAIGELQVPCPPLRDQERAVAEASAVRSTVAILSEAAGTAQRREVALRRALLRAAFSGRLTGRSSDVDLAKAIAPSEGALVS